MGIKPQIRAKRYLFFLCSYLFNIKVQDILKVGGHASEQSVITPAGSKVAKDNGPHGWRSQNLVPGKTFKLQRTVSQDELIIFYT